MTLSTNVYVLDPVKPADVFRFCQELLGKYDEQGRGPEQQVSSTRESWRSGAARIGNDMGQGLPALLDVTYCPDGPLTTAEEAAQHDSDCDDDCTGKYHSRACFLDVDFDTAYGYNHNGISCGALHARLVAELGAWLDVRGVRWEWRNEFTGDIHGGPDRYERLSELSRGGFDAAQWMRAEVLPAIQAATR